MGLRFKAQGVGLGQKAVPFGSYLNLTHQNPPFCRVPIGSIFGLILRG